MCKRKKDKNIIQNIIINRHSSWSYLYREKLMFGSYPIFFGKEKTQVDNKSVLKSAHVTLIETINITLVL